MSATPLLNSSSIQPKGVYRREDSVYTDGQYFEMTNPFHGIEGGYKPENKTLGLGSNKQKAINKANKINFNFDVLTEWEKLSNNKLTVVANEYDIDKPVFEVVLPRNVKTIDSLCDHYYAIKNKEATKGNYCNNSLSGLDGYLDDIKSFWKGQPLEYIDTGNIQSHIEHYAEHGRINKSTHETSHQKIPNKGRAAEALRSVYVNLLRFCKKRKLIDYKYNPAEDTDLDDLDTKVKRSRCSEAVYERVYTNSSNDKSKHYALCYKLALVTKLRLTDLMLIRNWREDDWMPKVKAFRHNRNYSLTDKISFNDRVEKAPYSYIDEEKEQLIIFQQKTGKLFKIPFDHKVSDSLPSVGEIVEELKSVCCEDSRFLINHPTNIGRAKKGNPIHPQTISRKFTGCIRELNLDWSNVNPPTFAELRSLGARLLEEYNNTSLGNMKQKELTKCMKELKLDGSNEKQSTSDKLLNLSERVMEIYNNISIDKTQKSTHVHENNSATIDEEVVDAFSANEGITESLGQIDRDMKHCYTEQRNLIDDCVGFT